MTVKVRLYAGLTGGLLVAALMSGRAEVVALAAPFAVALVLGLGLVERTVVTAEVGLPRERVLEGEPVPVEVHVHVNRPIARLEIAVDLPRGLTPADGRRVRMVSASPEEPAMVPFVVEPERWGAYVVGPVAFRTVDVAGFSRAEGVSADRRTLRVYPRPDALAALVAPAETQALVGNRLAPVRGDGIEFADLRRFVAGDRVREINWRIAARGRGLWVNQRHPERNSDVVLFVDTFSEALMERAVRAAAALVSAYGAERDRVGLVSFGGSLRWIEPGTGVGHLYRIAEALIDTQFFASYAWRGLGIVPARTIPAKALVLALTPLEDDRAIAALADLRRRGIDLAIIELAPTPVPTGATGVGDRVWELQQEVRRVRFRRVGVPVAVWSTDRHLAEVTKELSTWRRHARRRVG